MEPNGHTRPFALHEMVRGVDWDAFEVQRQARESQLHARELQRNFEEAQAQIGDLLSNGLPSNHQHNHQSNDIFAYSVTNDSSSSYTGYSSALDHPSLPPRLSNVAPGGHLDQHAQQQAYQRAHQPHYTESLSNDQFSLYNARSTNGDLQGDATPNHVQIDTNPFLNMTHGAWHTSKHFSSLAYTAGIVNPVGVQQRVPAPDMSRESNGSNHTLPSAFSPAIAATSSAPSLIAHTTTSYWYSAPAMPQTTPPEQHFPFHPSIFAPTAPRYADTFPENAQNAPPSYETAVQSAGVHPNLVQHVYRRPSVVDGSSASPASPSHFTSNSSDGGRYASSVNGTSVSAHGSSKQARFDDGTSSTATGSNKHSPAELPLQSAAVKSKGADTNATTGRREKKHLAELDAYCTGCKTLIAHLILRGKSSDIDVAHNAAYQCPDCATVPKNPVEPSSTFGYGVSISAAADRLEGLPVLDRDERPPPPANRTRPASYRKRSKRADAYWTPCDVCLRDIATGSVVPEDSRDTIEFAVEIICDRCWNRYKRCSECGAGGGARLGVGKWRSQELFDEGRKTCQLPHLRIGASTEMYHDVWRVRDIPPEDIDDVVERCGTLFRNTMLAGMCIPEVLETQNALCITYDQVVRMADDGWGLLQRVLRDDIEPTRQIRRYIGLRTCPPNVRKNRAAKPSAPGNSVFRDGAHLAGMVIAEWDQTYGTMYTTVNVPWATGDTDDTNLLLIQNLAKQMLAEREELNLERALQGLPPFPPINHIWTMLFFSRQSRVINHLERKRGFLPLADYAEQHSDCDLRAFPPEREVYLPRTFLTGWHVLVRRMRDPEVEWAPNRNKNVSNKQKAKSRPTKSLPGSRGMTNASGTSAAAAAATAASSIANDFSLPMSQYSAVPAG